MNRAPQPPNRRVRDGPETLEALETLAHAGAWLERAAGGQGVRLAVACPAISP